MANNYSIKNKLNVACYILTYVLVLSVASFLDNQTEKCDSKALQIFPSDITSQLTTSEQENW